MKFNAATRNTTTSTSSYAIANRQACKELSNSPKLRRYIGFTRPPEALERHMVEFLTVYFECPENTVGEDAGDQSCDTCMRIVCQRLYIMAHVCFVSWCFYQTPLHAIVTLILKLVHNYCQDGREMTCYTMLKVADR